MSEPVIELTVVVPCFNERDNIESLVDRLELVLAGIAWEVTFVDDDSTDGTIEVLRAIAGRNSRVRAIQRIGRRGLASADWPAPASRAACRRRRAFSP
jgi:dolichol-phosphate mannosyltransferase